MSQEDNSVFRSGLGEASKVYILMVSNLDSGTMARVVVAQVQQLVNHWPDNWHTSESAALFLILPHYWKTPANPSGFWHSAAENQSHLAKTFEVSQ